MAAALHSQDRAPSQEAASHNAVKLTDISVCLARQVARQARRSALEPCGAGLAAPGRRQCTVALALCWRLGVESDPAFVLGAHAGCVGCLGGLLVQWTEDIRNGRGLVHRDGHIVVLLACAASCWRLLAFYNVLDHGLASSEGDGGYAGSRPAHPVAACACLPTRHPACHHCYHPQLAYCQPPLPEQQHVCYEHSSQCCAACHTPLCPPPPICHTLHKDSIEDVGCWQLPPMLAGDQ